MNNNDFMDQSIKKDNGYMVQKKTDYCTDFEKGISYKKFDGKDVATMEEVMQYNQMFYERMMIKEDQEYFENKGGMHR